MNYIKKLPAQRVIKIHIVWRILGLLLWWGGYPYDTAGLTGQGFGILFAVFVLVGLQNDNFYSKWVWYIFTVFSTGTFYIVLFSQKVPYHYIVTFPVYLTQLWSVYKVYQEDKYS
jgi:hypothetical protein